MTIVISCRLEIGLPFAHSVSSRLNTQQYLAMLLTILDTCHCYFSVLRWLETLDKLFQGYTKYRVRQTIWVKLCWMNGNIGEVEDRRYINVTGHVPSKPALGAGSWYFITDFKIHKIPMIDRPYTIVLTENSQVTLKYTPLSSIVTLDAGKLVDVQGTIANVEDTFQLVDGGQHVIREVGTIQDNCKVNVALYDELARSIPEINSVLHVRCGEVKLCENGERKVVAWPQTSGIWTEPRHME